MERIYLICLCIGFLLPVCSFLIGRFFDFIGNALDGFFDGIDLSIEIGDTDLCFLPFSIYSICAGLLFYGAIGLTLYRGSHLFVINLIAGAIGYLVAVLIQNIIHRLKKQENTTLPKEQLLLYDAKVVHAIIEDGFGSISITTLDGITTTYPAKALESHVKIPQNTMVSIVRFDQNVAIVQPKELWKKYDLSSQ